MVLLMWVRVLSRMTPRLFTWGEGDTGALSMEVIYFREDGFGSNKEEFRFITVELEKV